MGRVDGKVVSVSGGARGMGATHAEALVSQGAHVVIGDILDHDGRAVAESLGTAALFVRLDVTRPDQWDAGVDAAVSAFGRLDAVELAGNGIRVNSIHPDLVHTPMSQGVTDDLLAPIPMRRGGTPSEVSTFVVFLVSDDRPTPPGRSSSSTAT